MRNLDIKRAYMLAIAVAYIISLEIRMRWSLAKPLFAPPMSALERHFLLAPKLGKVLCQQGQSVVRVFPACNVCIDVPSHRPTVYVCSSFRSEAETKGTCGVAFEH